MAFLKKSFKWLKRGVTPPESMQENGLKPLDGLPADYINEAWSATHEAIEELQEKAVEKVDGKGLSTNDYTDAERCKTIYATSSTGASTVIKLAPISGFKLFTGAGVRIKFNNGNTVDEPQLNVNGTGAKPLKKPDGTPFNNIQTGGIYTFIYDGVNYVVQGGEGVKDATTTQKGIVQLTNELSDNETMAVTPRLLKKTFDKSASTAWEKLYETTTTTALSAVEIDVPNDYNDYKIEIADQVAVTPATNKQPQIFLNGDNSAVYASTLLYNALNVSAGASFKTNVFHLTGGSAKTKRDITVILEKKDSKIVLKASYVAEDYMGIVQGWCPLTSLNKITLKQNADDIAPGMGIKIWGRK